MFPITIRRVYSSAAQTTVRRDSGSRDWASKNLNPLDIDARGGIALTSSHLASAAFLLTHLGISFTNVFSGRRCCKTACAVACLNVPRALSVPRLGRSLPLRLFP
ncbi:hypothetical protein CHELA1G11_12138 [Hyphomicrobiales bacterium]|nr:hypothetical protein CHELA1G11_12138 [Hyphomicrobiales bacterium]CAH1663042.1 hypothetical protein CHELA1G2_12175 [Hyphomicrobiales bacterium]